MSLVMDRLMLSDGQGAPMTLLTAFGTGAIGDARKVF